MQCIIGHITRDLQDVSGVFRANLYCHKLYIKKYVLQYRRRNVRHLDVKPQSVNQIAWNSLIGEIETGISNGEGHELCF